MRVLMLSPFVRQRLRGFLSQPKKEDLAVLKTLIEAGKVTPGRHPASRLVGCLLVAMAYQTQLDILQGTLDMLILQTLQWGPQHGHGIGQMIRHRSEDLVRLEHGSLYPALHRLERHGWIAAEWKASATNRRAKYYRLTPVGKKQLAAKRGKWDLLVRTIARIMRPA